MRGLGAALVVVTVASWAANAEEHTPAVAAARARQVAEIVGLQPILERIAHAPPGHSLEETLARLQLRDDILAELQRIDLLIDATIAQMDEERSVAASAQSFVEDGYTRRVAIWNIAALMVGSGLSIVGTAMQFDGTSQGYAGDAIILGGSAVATAFSIVALTRKKSGRTPHALETNFLAPLFGRASTPAGALPEPVWRYLDTPLAGERGSVRSELMERWIRRGTIAATDSPARRRKIDLLTRPIARREWIPSDVLDDRQEMLAELRARVAGMHVELQALVRQVRAEAAAPPKPLPP